MIHLIPKPDCVTWLDGIFQMPYQFGMPEVFPDTDSVFCSRLQQTGRYDPIGSDRPVISWHEKQMADEAYVLAVSENGINIETAGAKGYNYALVTLYQMLVQCDGSLPCCRIEDRPRFIMRGTMLDVCRHFFTVEEVRKIIEQCALLKLNHFHWHLSDDQGWRIESRKYPQLNEVSPWRTLAEGDPLVDRGILGAGERYGGYYTQDEIRDVVAYAAARGVEIIPEIDLPGHSSAVLAAYPEHTCTGAPMRVKSTFGVHERIFCTGRESVYDFLYGLLDELCELFPSKYIHLGGDEAPKTEWHNCPACRDRLQREGLKNYEALQASFTNWLVEYLRGKGRKVLLWNESAAAGNLDPEAVIQYWTEMAPGPSYIIPEVDKGRKLLLSNGPIFYCSDTYAELPMKATLMYEPEIKGQRIPYDTVLGVEAPMWTEWTPLNEDIEQHLYPRLLAVSECAWTREREFEDFLARAEGFLSVPTLNLLQPTPWEEATIHGEAALLKVAQGMLTLAKKYTSMTPVEQDEESGMVGAVVPEDSVQEDFATMVRNYMTDKMKAAYTPEEIDKVVDIIFAAMAGH